jgi:putative endonuclease
VQFFDAVVDIIFLAAVSLASDLNDAAFHDKTLKFGPEALFESVRYRITPGDIPLRENEKENSEKGMVIRFIRVNNVSMKQSKWFVYMIQSEKGHLYTGITTDVERRFKEHSDSKKGAKYFRGKVPVEVVYQKTFKDRSSASKYEAAIKKMPRANKIKLIMGENV